MQNSNQLPPEEDFFLNLIVRLKVAYRVLTARKAIVVIENEVDIFNMEAADVVAVASQMVGNFAAEMFEDMEQDLAIQNLVYGS